MPFAKHSEAGGVARSVMGAGVTGELWVATTGSDTTGDGTSGNPFATIDKARAVISANGWNGTRSVTVNVEAGDYWNTAVTFSAADSGSSTYPVAYNSVDGPGLARLLGGTVISPASWVHMGGNVYRTPLATPVYTMWENGVRGRAARIPKLVVNPSYPTAFAPYFNTTGVDFSYTIMKYNTLDFDPTGWSLSELRFFFWSTFQATSAWFSDVAAASSVDIPTQRFFWDHGGTKFFSRNGAPGARYYAQGILSMLTEPGEFVCSGGFMYYMARDGAIASQQIVVPTTKDVVSFVGTDANTRCQYINFDGFAVEYSEFNDWYRYGTNGNPPGPEYDYFYTPSTFQHAGVLMRDTDHIQVTKCHAKNAGHFGVLMTGYAQNNLVENSWVEYTGLDGIRINGPYPGTGDTAKTNTIRNTIVHNFGNLSGDGKGISLSQSGGNLITKFDIRRGPRGGIWIHGDYAVPVADNYGGGNLVEYGNVMNVMHDSGDAGSVTVSFRSAPTPPDTNPNVFNQIVIDGANAHPSMLDSAVPNGVFFDNHASGQVMSNTMVSNTQGAAQRYNDCSGAIFTNVNFTGSFDIGLMDFANIGISTANPYKTAAGL